MSPRTELEFHYNEKSFPIAATCAMCGEKMPKSTVEIKNAGDMVVWYAGQFRIHKGEKHPPEKPTD
jgi:hypothetical protein